MPPPHTPALHVSPVVQAFPSSQAPPLVATHIPVDAEQLLQPVHAAPSLCQAPFASHT